MIAGPIIETPSDNTPEVDENFVDKRGHKSRERRCVASGEVRDPADMIRFARSPDNVVVPDIMGKLPGRGVWVTSDRASLETAIKTNGFARGFKGKVIVPEDLIDQVHAGLRRQVLGHIAMTKKSGKLIMGFDQVLGAARSTALGWRIEASDGSPDGRGKIRTLSKAVARELEQPLPSVLGCFDTAELGQIIGRDTITHAALAQGKLSKRLKILAARLSGFESLIPLDWPDLEHELRGLPRERSEDENDATTFDELQDDNPANNTS
ncbi:RNA-binding protein [Litorimonas sp. RW-G-Af-16]|uniref:RNA-binding protein n=1 Tax=Litorimonas sp. RW-G-Af-16 TaxID=3241168 RepID=UPI00390CAA49